MKEAPSIGYQIRLLRRRATHQTPEERRQIEAGTAYSKLPIGKLATELLMEIFVLALKLNASRTVKSLMEVCRIWEDIVVSSARVN